MTRARRTAPRPGFALALACALAAGAPGLGHGRELPLAPPAPETAPTTSGTAKPATVPGTGSVLPQLQPPRLDPFAPLRAQAPAAQTPGGTPGGAPPTQEVPAHPAPSASPPTTQGDAAAPGKGETAAAVVESGSAAASDSSSRSVLLWYEHRGPRDTFQMFFPLYYSLANRPTKTRTSLLFPIFALHTSPTTTWSYFLTGYGYKGPSGWAGGLAPLAFFGRLDRRWHAVLFPILFAGGDDKSSTWVLGPGYFKRHTERDEGGRGFDAGLAPLLFLGKHGRGGYFSLAGLFTHVQSPQGHTTVVGPLYASARKDGYAYGLAPLFNVSRSGTRTTHWFLPPLYLHASDSSDRTQFTMFGPVFRQRDAEGQVQGVFPLAWDVDRGRRHTSALLPFYFHDKNDELSRESWQVGPYVRVRDDARKRLTQVLFPLYVQHDEPEYHAKVQFPFFFRIQDHDTTDTVLFPFYGGTRKPGFQADVVFPLFWRFAGTDRSTTVAGPFYYRHRPESSDGGLAPLFGWGKRAHGSYFWGLPLLYHDAFGKRSHTLALTFYYGRNDKDWTSFLLPIYGGFRRGPSAHVFGIPFYYGRDDERDKALLVAGPFFRGHSAHTRYAGLFPLLWLRSRDDGAASASLFPLFHFGTRPDGGHLLVTPLGGFATTSTDDNKYVIGPTYFRFQKGALRSLFLPLPFLYHGRDKQTGYGTTVWFPFFLRTTSADSTLTAVTPLYWRYRTADSLTNVALLYFDHHDFFKSKSFGVLPLFFHRDSFPDHERTDQALLFYQRKSPDQTDRVLFPVYWYFRRGADTTHVVAPIVWHWRRGSDTTTIVAPIAAHWKREDGDRTIVLNTYYRKGKGIDEGTWSFHFFPLFNVGRPRKDSFEWGILGGAITVTRSPQGRKLRLFWNFDFRLSGPPKTRRARVPAPQIF